MRPTFFFAALSFAVLAASVARAEDPPKKTDRLRIAVLDFRTEGKVDATGSKSAANIVRDEVDTSRYDLIDREMMRERMEEKDFASMTECDQVKCLVKFGKSLDAQKVVGGYLSSFGDGWVVTLRMVDVNTGSQERSFSKEFQGTQFEMLKLARTGAREIFGAAESRTTESSGPGDKTLALDLGSGMKMELVLVPAGEFLMGSSETEPGVESNERPQHKVKISKPFFMGKFEVTQAHWQAVMGNNPSGFKGDSNLPVEQVSWGDCQEFCRKLSQKSGKPIRLPTEAEWEYACRAGSTSRFSGGDSDDGLENVAWHTRNSGSKTHPVGGKRANAWGLFDMHGNVWEWCQDWFGDYPKGSVTDPSGPGNGPGRVIRGATSMHDPSCCRSAYRGWYSPVDRDKSIGFRVVSGTP